MQDHIHENQNPEQQPASEGELTYEGESLIEDSRPQSLGHQNLQQSITNGSRASHQLRIEAKVNNSLSVQRGLSLQKKIDNRLPANLSNRGLLDKQRTSAKSPHPIPDTPKQPPGIQPLQSGLEYMAQMDIHRVKQLYRDKSSGTITAPVQRAISAAAAMVDLNRTLAGADEAPGNDDEQAADEQKEEVKLETKISHTYGGLRIPAPDNEAERKRHPKEAFGTFKVGKKMEAKLVPEDPVVGSATDGFPTWMKYLKKKYNRGNWLVQGHLLNHDLGGFGRPENLYPITTRANKLHANLVEYPVKNALVRAHEYNQEADDNKYYVEYSVRVNEVSRPPEKTQFVCRWEEKSVNPTDKDLKSDNKTIDSKFDDGKAASPFLTADDKKAVAQIPGGSVRSDNLADWHHGLRKGEKVKRGAIYRDISQEHSDKLDAQRESDGPDFSEPHFDARYAAGGQLPDIPGLVANWALNRRGRFFADLCTVIANGQNGLPGSFNRPMRVFLNSRERSYIGRKSNELKKEVRSYLAGINYSDLPGYQEEMSFLARRTRRAGNPSYFADFDAEFNQWATIEELLNHFLDVEAEEEKASGKPKAKVKDNDNSDDEDNDNSDDEDDDNDGDEEKVKVQVPMPKAQPQSTQSASSALTSSSSPHGSPQNLMNQASPLSSTPQMRPPPAASAFSAQSNLSMSGQSAAFNDVPFRDTPMKILPSQPTARPSQTQFGFSEEEQKSSRASLRKSYGPLKAKPPMMDLVAFRPLLRSRYLSIENPPSTLLRIGAILYIKSENYSWKVVAFYPVGSDGSIRFTLEPVGTGIHIS